MGRTLVGVAATALGLAALVALGPDLAREEARLLRRALEDAVQGRTVHPALLLRDAIGRVLRLSGPIVLAAAAGAAAAGVLQTGGLLAPEALRFRPERLGPMAGLRRMLSGAALAQAALSLSAAAAAVAAGLSALLDAAPALSQAPRMRPPEAWMTAAGAGRAALLPLLGVLAAAGGADLLLQRRRHLRALRMTRAEQEREHREDEGDPRLRAERRRIQAGPPSSAPPAACVVVNPTRLAVALGHRRGSDDPPLVLAKGAGRRAASLRRAARLRGIPVVRDPALARALFRLAEVGEAIPEELYEAVAAVLAHVHGPGAERR